MLSWSMNSGEKHQISSVKLPKRAVLVGFKNEMNLNLCLRGNQIWIYLSPMCNVVRHEKYDQCQP